MSWRYNGNYCGWAPLPPSAVYHPTVGLTYRGQHVTSSFAFGLGVGSYTFVPVSRFSDAHPRRYAVTHPQAAQIYRQTVPSVTIVGNSARVANRGIPVSRVETAAHAQIQRVGIREVDAPGAHGARVERLEPNTRTLSVFRPQFPRSVGEQPAPGGLARPDLRQGSAGAAANPMPGPSRATPAPSMRPIGGSPTAQPNSGGGSGRRPDRAASQANAAPTTATGFATTHTVRGNSPGPRAQAPSQSSASAIDARPARPAAQRQDFVARPASAPTPRPFIVAEADDQSPSQPRSSALRSADLPVRSEQPRQFTAPTYQAPAATRYSAPAPTYTAPRAPSYSPPPAAPAPRAEPALSQPVHSAPAAPAPSAPAAHSSPSTSRGWR